MRSQQVAKVVVQGTNGVARQTRESDATKDEKLPSDRVSSAGAAALMYVSC